MKIWIVTYNFPHPKSPQSGAFVQKLADGMAISGAKINVYSLVSITNQIFRRKGPSENLQFADRVDVKYLNYVSVGNLNFFGFSFTELGYKLAFKRLKKAIEKDIQRDGAPDFLIGKFLLSGGENVARLSNELGIPAIADIGESKLLDRLTPKELLLAREVISRLKGAVCVSRRLVSELIQLGMEPNRLLMLPNGVDNTKFFPLDMISARTKLGLPIDKKIVVFVGHFIHRKGAERVLQAIEKLPTEYCGVFLGEGPVSLDSTRVLFKGRVANDVLNTWLNAADVFCLPTLAEGSCNAIEEARAAGLPIVTSNIPDITDFESSQEYILIDPHDIEDIAQGIQLACSQERPRYQNSPISSVQRSKIIMEWLYHIDDLDNP